MAKKKQEATFELRFFGGDVTPEKVTVRAVSDALNAVQDLSSGRDPYEERRVDYDKGIGLVRVLKGSAVYRCASRDPVLALKNLRRVKSLVHPNGDEHLEDIETLLNPIQSLSDVAKSLDCKIEIREFGTKKPLFQVDKEMFSRISERVFVQGPTTLVGRIERAGGSTEMKCAMRITGRRTLLYCDVASKAVVRRLGEQLYQTIAAQGEATWIQPSWRVYKFNIIDFTQPKIGRFSSAMSELRDAGLDAWDQFSSSKEIAEEMGR